MKDWKNIVAISCGRDYVIGLTAEGRVLSAGTLRVEQGLTDLFQTLQSTSAYTREIPNTDGWREVLAIQAGPDHALAMTREGTILATGLDSDGQCTSTAHFTLFRDSRQLYGYGKYRKLVEHGMMTGQEASAQAETSVEDDATAFCRISAHLRADTQKILSCLSGDDRYLTVCASDGDDAREITYCYETAEKTAATLDYLASRAFTDEEEEPINLLHGWSHAVSILSSGAHTVALFEDGHVEAMGQNERGECNTEDWYHVIQIAVMPELTLGLRADGKVLAAGRHHTVLNTLDTVRAIACFGSCRQVFVMADGSIRIHVRGSEFLPEPLGDIRVFTPSVENSVLRRYMPNSNSVDAARSALSSFALGMGHSLKLDGAGAVMATGADDCGQCGLSFCGDALQVAAGPYHSAAILTDGSIMITGRNTDGRCDHRTLNRERDTVGASTEDSIHSSSQSASRSVLQFHAWLQVACGHEHTVALRSDGRVFAVGASPDGRLDTRKWRDIQYVACGVRHTVALRADGTCVATGDNRYGQCDLSLWKNIVLVAAGEFHTVGLRADGRVEVAGDNRKGQCHAEDLRDVISVACLPEATLCVCADGRVVMRGGDGELGKAVESLREVVAIHTCEHRLAALTVDRRVIHLP